MRRSRAISLVRRWQRHWRAALHDDVERSGLDRDGVRAWARSHRVAAAFALACVVAVAAGRLVLPSTHRASTTIVVRDEAVRSEWDLLKDETRDVDFEEQILSRAVLESALRDLGLFPPPPRRFLWWRGRALTEGQERQALARLLPLFRRSMRVERLRRSGILRISAMAGSPADAAARANAVTRTFINYQRSQAVADAERRLAAVDAELRPVGEGLDTLQALRSEFLVYDASLQELARQLAGADARLGQARSRYKGDNPMVLQAVREKSSLEAVLREWTQGRRAALQRRASGERERLAALVPEAPEAGTLDALIDHARQRYQELLRQRSEAHLLLTTWRAPSSSFRNLAVLDEALPPVEAPIWLRIPVTLLVALLLGVVSFFAAQIALNLFETRLRGAARAPRALSAASLDPDDGSELRVPNGPLVSTASFLEGTSGEAASHPPDDRSVQGSSQAP